MTRAHVPPQSAGNTEGVRRSRVLYKEHRRYPDKKYEGGLHVLGLCAACNNELQRSYDDEYARFAHRLRHTWIPNPLPGMPSRHVLPGVDLAPGAVARSVLIGAFALSPQLRVVLPDAARALVDRDQVVPLPTDLRLRLALCAGRVARIGGPDYYMLARGVGRGKTVPVNSAANIHFPPFAWYLAWNDSAVLDRQGWADVSGWLATAPDVVEPLANVCPRSLPIVIHPADEPHSDDRWVRMLSSDITELLTCDELPPALLDSIPFR